MTSNTESQRGWDMLFFLLVLAVFVALIVAIFWIINHLAPTPLQPLPYQPGSVIHVWMT